MHILCFYVKLYKDLISTFISGLILQVLAYVAEQERQNIKQRQSDGIAIAKAQRKYLGRPKAEYPNGFENVYRNWKDKKITTNLAMEQLRLRLRSTTFYKLVKQYESRD